MNIFTVIGRTTRRIEPFHSMFLADALRENLSTDRTFFDEFWNRAVGSDSEWPSPTIANVKAEDVIGRMRVDITIVDCENQRCLGIEVKTDDTSTEIGQLAAYQEGLENKYSGYHVRMAYLTPFNRQRTPIDATQPHAVAEFESFASSHAEAVHLSWLDIAEIEWASGGEAWSNHQTYVQEVICHRRSTERRGLDAFFGPAVVDEFWSAIARSGGPSAPGNLELINIANATAFINSFRILIEAPAARKDRVKLDKFRDQLREPFWDSHYADIHKNLFALADEYPWVWIEGSNNYGIRVAHPDRTRGVSISTSLSVERFSIGRLR